MKEKPILGILLGDAAGVGPEIVAKVAAANFFDEYCRPVIMGDLRVFERGCKVSGVEVKTQVISDVSEATWKDGIPFLDFLQKNDYPTAPMLLSFVLAPLLESNMRKAFIISGGSLNIFFTRPITCVLMIIFLIMVAVPVFKAVTKKNKPGKQA